MEFYTQNMKKYLFLFVSALFLTGAAGAQSSEKLTELISTDKATYGQASYLSAVYSGLLSEDADYEEAVKKLAENKILKEGTDPSKAVTLSELSYICTKTAGTKGGLFYTLFPGPRYALRELKAKGIIPDYKDPSSKVSGREVIALFNAVLEQNDGGEN